MLALEGIKVLDFGRGAPAPFCTWVLGDLGAEVIRIEVPPGASRLQGRAAVPQSFVSKEEERRRSAYNVLGRNKKSIALNLRSEEGRKIFYQLAEKADVVVDEFRPDVIKRLGVDYETVSKINPRIIYCSITSYGQNGPYRDIIAHDINSDGMAGALDLIGEKDGPPIVPLNLLADYGGGGIGAVVGILGAIIARNETGKGQYIDISMLDSVIMLMAPFIGEFLGRNVVPKRGETLPSGGFPYYGVYETKDGKYITIGNVEPWLWGHFCRVINREDLIPYRAKREKWEELSSYFKQLFLTKTRDEWFELLSPKGVFIGKVHSIDEVVVNPQVLHREMVVEVADSDLGKVRHPGIAIKLSDTPGKVRSLSPMLGENTDEILTGLGYSEQGINELRQEGIII